MGTSWKDKNIWLIHVIESQTENSYHIFNNYKSHIMTQLFQLIYARTGNVVHNTKNIVLKLIYFMILL